VERPGTQVVIRVEDDIIAVIADPEHEWTLGTAEVAKGYGVTPENIRVHKHQHKGELIKGKHFFSVRNTNGGNLERVTTLWTKRGVIRLGFFIRSERAKKFRDAAEDLIIQGVPQASGDLRANRNRTDRGRGPYLHAPPRLLPHRNHADRI